MKKILLVMVAALLICFSAAGAQADTTPYFAYDNFTNVFGTTGNPGSANSVFTSNGQLLDFNTTNIEAFFVVQGVTPGFQVVSATQGETVYNGTLTIYDNVLHSNVLWLGTGFLKTIINLDGSTFPAIYPRPSTFAGQPNNYNSIGNGFYSGSGSGIMAAYDHFSLDWFGSYNWSYDNSVNKTWTALTTYQVGNAQGGVSVPEPASLLLLGLGLVGIAGIRRRVKK